MLPSDAVTVFAEYNSSGTRALVSGNSPKTIIGIKMSSSGNNGYANVQCGTTKLASQYGRQDMDFTEIAYYCANTINFQQGGNDYNQVLLTYVPRNTLTTNDPRGISVKDMFQATASAQLASISGTVNIASQSSYAIGNGFYVIWFMLGIGIFLAAIQTMLLAFNKK